MLGRRGDVGDGEVLEVGVVFWVMLREMCPGWGDAQGWGDGRDKGMLMLGDAGGAAQPWRVMVGVRAMLRRRGDAGGGECSRLGQCSW